MLDCSFLEGSLALDGFRRIVSIFVERQNNPNVDGRILGIYSIAEYQGLADNLPHGKADST